MSLSEELKKLNKERKERRKELENNKKKHINSIDFQKLKPKTREKLRRLQKKQR